MTIDPELLLEKLKLAPAAATISIVQCQSCPSPHLILFDAAGAVMASCSIPDELLLAIHHMRFLMQAAANPPTASLPTSGRPN